LKNTEPNSKWLFEKVEIRQKEFSGDDFYKIREVQDFRADFYSLKVKPE